MCPYAAGPNFAKTGCVTRGVLTMFLSSGVPIWHKLLVVHYIVSISPIFFLKLFLLWVTIDWVTRSLKVINQNLETTIFSDGGSLTTEEVLQRRKSFDCFYVCILTTRETFCWAMWWFISSMKAVSKWLGDNLQTRLQVGTARITSFVFKLSYHNSPIHYEYRTQPARL